MRNPYVCGGWVAGPQFYGRQTLLEQILGVDAGMASDPMRADRAIYVMGGRRSGKTSLLRRVEELCAGQRERLCLFLDLQIAGRSLEGLFQTLRAELRRKAQHRDYFPISGLMAAPDALTLSRELVAKLEVLGIELLLLLDEAEILLDLAQASPGPLAQLWRVWSEGSVLRLVVAASRGLTGLCSWLDPHLPRPLWHGFCVQGLARLDDDAAEALIQQRNSPAAVSAEPFLMQQIREVTGCQPYLLQWVCQRLYQPDGTLHGPAEMDFEMDELLASLFRADYQNLLAEEREALWLIVHGGGDIEDLQSTAGPPDELLSQCLSWLECLGYIRGVHGECRLANRFLETWLLGQQDRLREIPCNPYVVRELPGLGHGLWPV